MGSSALDVVIPARGEAETLPGCLLALLAEARGLDVKVIVVANGADREPTLAAARGFEQAFESAGVPLTVVEAPTPGKPQALNRGDEERRGGAVMYLDADTVLLAGTLEPIVRELTAREAPLLMAPRPRLLMPQTWVARHRALVWRTLPAVADQVIGGGCYSVNGAGRGRWDRFPDVLGDDSFVRSRFGRADRKLSDDGGFIQVLPEGKALIASLRRWRAANEGLRPIAHGSEDAPTGRGSDPGAGLGRNLIHILTRPDLWPYVPGFLFADLQARSSVSSADDSGAWTPLRADERVRTPPRRLCVHVVSGQGASAPGSHWAEVLSGPFPAPPEMISHTLFAEEPLPDGALDDLLAFALRFPGAGAWLVSPQSLDERAPFAVRTASANGLDGPVLVSAEALRDLGTPYQRIDLSELRRRGWRPVRVQSPRRVERRLI